MNPISDTAIYCCGVRMEDAERAHSACNDHYAKIFMDDRCREIYAPFRSEKNVNASIITRCRIIDDFIRQKINDDQNIRVITVGAGFDTRPYRIAGGDWIEVDEPQIINYKNEKLAVKECKNPLRRISVDFSGESLIDKLNDLKTDQPVVIVIEGVFMYLDSDAISKTIRDLQMLFPRHTLFCDLMAKNFYERFKGTFDKKIGGLGTAFILQSDSPESFFTRHHYAHVSCTPIFKKSAEMGVLKELCGIPKIVAYLLFYIDAKDLRGNSVHQFQYQGIQ